MNKKQTTTTKKRWATLSPFQPKPFSGTDQEDAPDFLKSCQIYANQAKFEEHERVCLFKCFLQGRALSWFDALFPAKITTFSTLQAKFGYKALT